MLDLDTNAPARLRLIKLNHDEIKSIDIFDCDRAERPVGLLTHCEHREFALTEEEQERRDAEGVSPISDS